MRLRRERAAANVSRAGPRPDATTGAGAGTGAGTGAGAGAGASTDADAGDEGGGINTEGGENEERSKEPPDVRLSFQRKDI